MHDVVNLGHSSVVAIIHGQSQARGPTENVNAHYILIFDVSDMINADGESTGVARPGI